MTQLKEKISRSLIDAIRKYNFRLSEDNKLRHPNGSYIEPYSGRYRIVLRKKKGTLEAFEEPQVILSMRLIISMAQMNDIRFPATDAQVFHWPIVRDLYTSNEMEISWEQAEKLIKKDLIYQCPYSPKHIHRVKNINWTTFIQNLAKIGK